MNARIETSLPPFRIWDAWVKAHAAAGLGQMEQGKKGVSKGAGISGFKYQIQNVVEGESFSILWKALFVRLIFSYAVKPFMRGSEVSCSVEIRGLFALPVRWALGRKIQKKLAEALHSMVRQLEKRR